MLGGGGRGIRARDTSSLYRCMFDNRLVIGRHG